MSTTSSPVTLSFLLYGGGREALIQEPGKVEKKLFLFSHIANKTFLLLLHFGGRSLFQDPSEKVLVAISVTILAELS